MTLTTPFRVLNRRLTFTTTFRVFDQYLKSIDLGSPERRENSETKKKSIGITKMAGRLSGVASRIMGGNGVVARSNASSLRQRAGMGLPVGKHIVPDKPVSQISPISNLCFDF